MSNPFFSLASAALLASAPAPPCYFPGSLTTKDFVVTVRLCKQVPPHVKEYFNLQNYWLFDNVRDRRL